MILLYALLSLTVLRMLPVFLSLTGSGIDTEGKLFIGWFGPRGLASIVFAVIVVESGLPGSMTLAVTVVCTIILSIVAHGISANPWARAYGRRRNRDSWASELSTCLTRRRQDCWHGTSSRDTKAQKAWPFSAPTRM